MKNLALILMMLSSLVAFAAEDKPASKCEDALVETSDFCLGATLKLFNFSKKNNFEIIDQKLIDALQSENQMVASRARVLVLKTLYDNADTREAALFFTVKLALLIPPPSLIYDMLPRDGFRGLQLYESIMRENIKELTLDLWYLTLVRITNYHPSILLNDVRNIGAIGEQLFWKSPLVQLSGRMPFYREFLIAYSDVRRLKDEERQRLIYGEFARPMTLLEPMEEFWLEALQRGWDKNEVPQKDIIEFAKKLGLKFRPLPRSRGGSGQVT